MVPAAPQRRLVRHRVQTESIAETGVLGEVFDERGLVVPAVAFLQEEYAKQRLHIVGCRACVAVVRFESEITVTKLNSVCLICHKQFDVEQYEHPELKATHLA